MFMRSNRLDELKVVRPSLDDVNVLNDAKVDKTATGSKRRTLVGWSALLVSAIAIAASLFHLSLTYFGMLESMRMRASHLAFLVPLAFLLIPAGRRSPKNRFTVVDGVWFAVTLFSCIYIGYLEYDRLVSRFIYVAPLTTLDLAAGIALIICTLEAARRAVGLPLVIIAGTAVAYAFLGHTIPGALGHSGFSVKWVVEHLSLTTEGILGIPVGASASFVFLFVLFGKLLQFSGAGQFFIDAAYAVAGWARGGPAKMAVISSGLMGMVSGTAVGNVVTTGSYTIPLMKKVGYKASFAGAVESAASVGGQIMPPIMGASAFIMADFLGIPYLQVAAAAAIPAVLFFLSVGIMVDFEAQKHGLRGLPKEELPDLRKVLKKDGHLALPLFVIIFLLVRGYTPYMAATGAIISIIAVSSLRAHTRMTFKQLLVGLSLGAQGAVVIAVTCAVAGLVIGPASLTGLAVKFAGAILRIAAGRLFFALPLIMMTSIVLGMGLPTTAAYIMVAALAVPALVQMGVLPLAAHLFAFYFACMSAITPPVAIAAYAAAGLADSPAFKTGWQSVKLAAAGFIVPFMFAYGPHLLLVGTPARIALGVGTALIGCVALSGGIVGFFRRRSRIWETALLLFAAFVLISPVGFYSLVGVALMGSVYLLQGIGRPKAVVG